MAATFSSNMVSTSFLKRQPMAVSSLKSLSPKICQSLFGLKSANSRGGRVVAMAVHKVKLITPEGKKEFKCPDNSYILERAEEEGIDLPYTCLAGACSSCAGKVISGTVDQSLNSFLEQEQIDEGWVLTCVARPKGDVVIQTHMEGELFA